MSAQQMERIAAPGTEGRIAGLGENAQPAADIRPPGYARAVYMARYLLGKDEPNTNFHSSSNEPESEGALISFRLNYPDEPQENENHDVFLASLELPGISLAAIDEERDGVDEDIRVVLDGTGIISRQVILVPELEPGAAFVTYMGRRSAPAEETLVDMGFPAEELSGDQVLPQGRVLVL